LVATVQTVRDEMGHQLGVALDAIGIPSHSVKGLHGSFNPLLVDLIIRFPFLPVQVERLQVNVIGVWNGSLAKLRVYLNTVESERAREIRRELTQWVQP
jgi:hypothetical protein